MTKPEGHDVPAAEHETVSEASEATSAIEVAPWEGSASSPEAEPEQVAAPVVVDESEWLAPDPNLDDNSPWVRPVADPLASLPAAPILPIRPLEPGRSVSAEAHLARPPSSSAPVTAAQARAGTVPNNEERGDLWFLSTEPQGVEDPGAAAAAQVKESASWQTAALTVAMAALVIILVYVFIQFMTSLLR